MPRRKRQPESRLAIDGQCPPREVVGAIATAWNLAATMEGAHFACQRRECREHRRCRAAYGYGRDRFCVVTLSGEADKRALGMLVFLMRLSYDPPP